MFERLSREVRVVVQRAADQEAAALGSRTVEAEHLLLALGAGPSEQVAALLDDEGLDRDGLIAALERESERSLAAVGVEIGDYAPAALSLRPPLRPRFAASAKRALERTLPVAAARGDRRVGAAHLLVGVLLAELGTVPRALSAAGVDRAELLARAERLLD